MKILVIGGTGIIGKAIVKSLEEEHNIIAIGHTKGRYQVDISQKKSIEQLLKKFGSVDAIICAAGTAAFGPLNKLTDDEFQLTLNNQLMGQINVARLGIQYLNPNGMIILTSGTASYNPMIGSTAISTSTAGLEGFVRAAALEMPNNTKINVVSPSFVKETMESMGIESSHGISALDTADVYKKTLLLNESGLVVNVLESLNEIPL